MKNYIANIFIHKGKNTERKNLMIKSESDSEDVLKSLIKEKIVIDSEKYEFVSDKYEFIAKESVIIYESEWKTKSSGDVEKKLDFSEIRKFIENK